jgi:hypothetical protein
MEEKNEKIEAIDALEAAVLFLTGVFYLIKVLRKKPK